MSTDQATSAARRRNRRDPAQAVNLGSVARDLATAEATLRRAGRLTPRLEMALNAARWGVAELITQAVDGPVVADAA